MTSIHAVLGRRWAFPRLERVGCVCTALCASPCRRGRDAGRSLLSSERAWPARADPRPAPPPTPPFIKIRRIWAFASRSEWLLEAALKLFTQHGYAETSLRRLAEKVGVRE
ncbi:helix-turn-helix domain-containing protein [Nonomuraea turcica]|uniref:helix-turn-helix domain-containing protein n=1 Tax=Nonomuraea sp. G32 TaxID=3067274 RepID=UPI003530477A